MPLRRQASGHRTQQLQRARILHAIEVPGQHGIETAARSCDFGEQRHAGAELDVVGGTEDPMGGQAVIQAEQDAAGFAQALAEHGMLQVGRGLRPGLDGVALRHVAAAQAEDLGKDEPHPVGALTPCFQFGQYPAPDGLLGMDEAGKGDGCGHRPILEARPRKLLHGK